ncbi:MAG TPA: hypothetical protein VL154_03880 [Acetobacteraceae bacterium]|jgi:hypothetical protein|nr:hypothetical protein [Acetobacteraceae bacterium]
MTIASFDDLLQQARAEADQRLLLVFTAAELPDHATPAQRAAFEAGEGGTLAPLMCVDKAPAELASFAALVEESRRAGPDWAVLFTAALPGPAATADIEAALQRMVDSIKTGDVEAFLPFNRQGEPVLLG